jgi:3-oxoacyl-[acyl-carrier-protein] synthase-1
MITGEVVITGVGALTPVGLSAPASFAALRAGVARMGEIETLKVDGDGFDKVPAIGGRVPTEWFQGGPTEWEWPGHDRFGVAPPPAPERLVAPGPKRLVELGAPAVLEAWRAAVPGKRPGPAGFYLGLDDADEPEPIVRALINVLDFDFSVVRVAPSGRAGGLLAIEGAMRDLAAGTVECALVGGIDSQVREASLERLAERKQLKSDRNPQGTIPGEGACFVVLERPQSAASRGARPLARMLASTSRSEPTVSSGEPNRAEALSEVLRWARQAGAVRAAPLVICDLNGDRYRAIEWSMARLRAFGDLEGDLPLWHGADCIGDCGAASGALNAGWAVAAFQRGYAGKDHVVVWGASDSGARAAVVLAPARA